MAGLDLWISLLGGGACQHPQERQNMEPAAFRSVNRAPLDVPAEAKDCSTLPKVVVGGDDLGDVAQEMTNTDLAARPMIVRTLTPSKLT